MSPLRYVVPSVIQVKKTPLGIAAICDFGRNESVGQSMVLRIPGIKKIEFVTASPEIAEDVVILSFSINCTIFVAQILRNSPTRFGRIDLEFEPAGARFDRSEGPSPSSISLPGVIGQLRVQEVIGARSRITAEIVEIDPIARKWEVLLK